MVCDVFCGLTRMEMTRAAAHSFSEVDLLLHDGFLSHLDESMEKKTRDGKKVMVVLVLDRGYYDVNVEELNKKFENMVVHKVSPFHLDPPSKTRRKAGEEKKKSRKHFSGDEVVYNTAVASIRAINEIANGRAMHSEVYHGT